MMSVGRSKPPSAISYSSFYDVYLYPLKKAFTGYSALPTIGLTDHLYESYARISTTELSANNARLREACDPNEPFESLNKRLNECDD